MQRSRVYSQEEREKKMATYLLIKKRSGSSDKEIAESLGINPSTIYEWKKTDWYEDLSYKVIHDVNLENMPVAINKIGELIEDDDPEVAIKAIREARLYYTEMLSSRQTNVKDDEGGFNTELFMRIMEEPLKKKVEEGDVDG